MEGKPSHPERAVIAIRGQEDSFSSDVSPRAQKKDIGVTHYCKKYFPYKRSILLGEYSRCFSSISRSHSLATERGICTASSRSSIFAGKADPSTTPGNSVKYLTPYPIRICL